MKAIRFKIEISNEELEELQRRLDATRWPIPMDGESWDDGASLTFIKRLV